MSLFCLHSSSQKWTEQNQNIGFTWKKMAKIAEAGLLVIWSKTINKSKNYVDIYRSELLMNLERDETDSSTILILRRLLFFFEYTDQIHITCLLKMCLVFRLCAVTILYCAPWPLWPLKPLTARLSWAVEPVSWPCAAVTGAALSCACDTGGSSDSAQCCQDDTQCRLCPVFITPPRRRRGGV